MLATETYSLCTLQVSRRFDNDLTKGKMTIFQKLSEHCSSKSVKRRSPKVFFKSNSGLRFCAINYFLFQ